MKRAVVLLNLGGPDSPDAVEPFLRSLFSDPAILRVPGWMRGFLARAIARSRAAQARENYARLGGASPLLSETKAQADALAHRLDMPVLIAMRHWHPRADAVARELVAQGTEEVLFLPLYPQFSTTTTGSSFADLERALMAAGYRGTIRRVCCYPQAPGFIAALAEGLGAAIDRAQQFGRPRILLSAHGLPERIVKSGDPYQWQVEQTAAALKAAVGMREADWTVCYQSRVGPLKWIGPETRTEIRAAAADRRPIVIMPIAFVSEHVETLVELDVEYRALAEDAPAYLRAPTVRAAPMFIAGLAELAGRAFSDTAGRNFCAGQSCPIAFRCCPNNRDHRESEPAETSH